MQTRGPACKHSPTRLQHSQPSAPTWFSGITNGVLSTNAQGQVVATSSIGTNYLTGNLGTVNGTPFNVGSSITVGSASTTLLANNNTFSGANSFTGNTTFANATSTNFFSTTASSTNLFAQTASIGSLNLGTALTIANGGTNATSYTQGQLLSFNGTSFVSTSTIGNNQLANSSVTINSTNVALGGSATITAASSTLLANNNTFSGANTFSQTITGAVSGNAGTATALQNARTINGVSFNGTANIILNAASSTLLTDNNFFSGTNGFSNTTFTNATTSNFAISNLANTLLAVNANGTVVATSTIGNNQLQNSSVTINSTNVALGGSITISAASSTLLANNNNWTGLQNFANSSSTLATLGTTWFSGITNGILSTNAQRPSRRHHFDRHQLPDRHSWHRERHITL